MATESSINPGKVQPASPSTVLAVQIHKADQPEAARPTFEVLSLDAGVKVDEAFHCPNNDQLHYPWLGYKDLQSAVAHGYPRCMLLCNLLTAIRPQREVSHVENLHGEKGLVAISDRQILSFRPQRITFYYANPLRPVIAELIFSIPTDPEPKYDAFNFYGETVHEPLCPTGFRFTPGNTNSPETLNAALAWLQQCTSNHVTCNNITLAKLPTRVLDISSFPIRLHETSGQQERYACLSHCWSPKGESKVLRTTRKNLDIFNRDIPWEQIPQAFRDAIHFARGLEICYLWIDSLCIIQDDASNWERESARMADIYSNSYVVIAATTSENADGDLFTKPHELSPPIQGANWHTGNGSVHLVFARSLLYHRLEFGMNATLLTRGWVVQETLLSPRTIHFSGPEAIWECREVVCSCECGLDYGNVGGHKTPMWRALASWDTASEKYEAWLHIVTLYLTKF